MHEAVRFSEKWSVYFKGNWAILRTLFKPMVLSSDIAGKLERDLFFFIALWLIL